MTGSRVLHVYLVRHARAEARGLRWPDDRRRPLSPAGIAAFSALLRTPRVRRSGVTLVLTSGLSRATGTARLLARAVTPEADVRVCRALEPGGDPAHVVRALRRHRATRIAIVGHEPDLSALAAFLTGHPVTHPFPKGAMCRMRLRCAEAGAARIMWMATPPTSGQAAR